MTLLLTKRNNDYEITTIESSMEELELDFARQDFENKWQEAMTKEDITNAIFGLHIDYKNGVYPNYDIESIKNQARTGSAPI